MADQLRGDALFSYAVEHYLDTVYRAAFHAAPFAPGRRGRGPGGL